MNEQKVRPVPASGYCESCARIDFSSLFQSKPPETPEEQGEFFLEWRFPKNYVVRDCILCEIIHQNFFKTDYVPNGGGDNWRIGLRLASCGINKAADDDSDSAEAIMQIVEHCFTERTGQIMENTLGSLRQDTCQPKGSFLGHESLLCRDASEYEIENFETVKLCLAECLRNDGHSGHDFCRRGSVSSDLNIWVIDCETRHIISFSGNEPYLALSYVWGPSTSSSTQCRRTSVPEPAERTVEDAMKFTKSIGMRHLWVDRYCIINSDHKHEQIRNMHKLYGNAFLTLVATEGSDSEAGLSGVSRPLQRTSFVKDGFGVQVIVDRNTYDSIHKSTWASRAWTFQEAILSTRCLYFTANRTFFSCRSIEKAVAAQSISVLCTHRKPQPIQNGSHTGWYNSLSSIEYYASAYSKLSLSYASDGLNAFRGILEAYNDGYNTCSYWGYCFPLRVSKATLLETFSRLLTWQSTNHKDPCTTSRTDFPTWTWVRHPMIEWPRHQFTTSPWKQATRIMEEVYVEDTHGSLIPLENFVGATAEGNRTIPELTRYLIIESQFMELQLTPLPDPNRRNAYAGEIITPFETDRDNILIDSYISWDNSAYREDAKLRGIALWGALLIVENESFSTWIILEDMGECWHRVGSICSEKPSHKSRLAPIVEGSYTMCGPGGCKSYLSPRSRFQKVCMTKLPAARKTVRIG